MQVDNNNSAQFERKLRIAISDKSPRRNIAITCHCGNRWIEHDIPVLLDTIDAVIVFECEVCHQLYGQLLGNKVVRINKNFVPEVGNPLTEQLPTAKGNA